MTYTWNARNQMTATSAGSATFSYDALGRRVGATVNGSTVNYLYDGLNPATVSSSLVLASGNLDEIYALVGASGTTSYLRDGINNTAVLTSSSGTVSGNYYYSPYGDSVQTGSATTPFQFTGRENDGATGLYYYRARYYSPQLGRFVSEDPLGIGGGTNFYAYAGGSPVGNFDPLGLAWQVTVGMGGAVIAPGVGASGSVNIGINFDYWNSTIYVQDQVSGGIGGGAYLGFGPAFGATHSDAGPTSGFATNTYGEVDAAIGPGFGASTTGNDSGGTDNGGSSGPGKRMSGGKTWPGMGAGGFAGYTATATGVSPTIGDVACWLNSAIESALRRADCILWPALCHPGSGVSQ